jgi:hypothetical protein
MDALLGAAPDGDDENGAEEEDFGFANIEEVRLHVVLSTPVAACQGACTEPTAARVAVRARSCRRPERPHAVCV